MTRCVGLYKIAAVPNGEVHFPNAGTLVALLLVEDQQWHTCIWRTTTYRHNRLWAIDLPVVG